MKNSQNLHPSIIYGEQHDLYTYCFIVSRYDIAYISIINR